MQMLTDEIRVHGPDGRAPRPLLVVDDDDLELCLIADRLGAAGYNVTTAHNGAEAKRMMSTGAFPVVITDWQMPQLDGLQFVEQVRAEEADRSYLIMWSIRADESDRERGFHHGADDYVSKKSTDAELLARIEAGFNTVHMRQSLSRARSAQRRPTIEESGDRDAWKAAASRLHAEMTRARRYDYPLTVMMLHVERNLAQPNAVALQTSQLSCLVSAIHSAIRHSADWVMPIELAAGHARIMAVFPETGRAHAAVIRDRIGAALTDLTISDEFAELNAECSAGLATVDCWTDGIATNAATLVAQAEQQLAKLR